MKFSILLTFCAVLAVAIINVNCEAEVTEAATSTIEEHKASELALLKRPMNYQ
jgi:Na+-translocating ferredoxin:NAD+ oxidoreductase RnfA subunit